MKPGDICVLVGVRPSVMGTIIREIRHPYLEFRKAYHVVDVNGKEHRVSESFVKQTM
jgi:hypothetical protein